MNGIHLKQGDLLYPIVLPPFLGNRLSITLTVLGNLDILRQKKLALFYIEDYPEDKYSPSVLLLGFATAGRPLHFQVSLAETDLTR